MVPVTKPNNKQGIYRGENENYISPRSQASNQSKLDDRLHRSRRYSSNGLRPLLCSVLEMDSESSTSSSARSRCDLTFAAGYASSSRQSSSAAPPWSAMLDVVSPRSMLSICTAQRTGQRNAESKCGLQGPRP